MLATSFAAKAVLTALLAAGATGHPSAAPIIKDVGAHRAHQLASYGWDCRHVHGKVWECRTADYAHHKVTVGGTSVK